MDCSKDSVIHSMLLLMHELGNSELVRNSISLGSIDIKDGYVVLKFTSKVKIKDES